MTVFSAADVNACVSLNQLVITCKHTVTHRQPERQKPWFSGERISWHKVSSSWQPQGQSGVRSAPVLGTPQLFVMCCIKANQIPWNSSRQSGQKKFFKKTSLILQGFPQWTCQKTGGVLGEVTAVSLGGLLLWERSNSSNWGGVRVKECGVKKMRHTGRVGASAVTMTRKGITRICAWRWTTMNPDLQIWH